DADPAPDLVAAAERHAAAYPERAASIRRTGRLPYGEVRYFDPPEAALVKALVAGRTPALAALDRAVAEPCPVRACPGGSPTACAQVMSVPD
ncbi:MAG TPA: hypothetical protein VKS60_01450, partial [Stellaceae bacterium]|nr:hypothetical protein [Stellaceae bacterium]